ncbi:SMC family ATPase [Microbacterium aoyamense]|uniref:Nuclease SbcCD subunit C n=1 Tax=Microbacterium aoyamense TaxID=344166 RepID=A0ABP5AL35_9MICO|nr:SMC family ATPase [Microbacterium aoyamense]
MRLHRLELEGFGPFRERQTIDFDAFADDGIFLIAGRTGAGKSSVLDGVCFALYGGAPRYDGAEKRLRSDHCAPEDPTSVIVEFTAGGRRWRVTRSPEYERPKQRGTGLTTEPHRAQLDERVDGAWIGRAARPVDVARELDEILGLSQQQFLQVILLAQNRFAEFLLAKNDDRQRLLRRLFGTRTYEDYQAAFDQRRKDSERALSSAGEGVQLLLGEAERVLSNDLDADELIAAGAVPDRIAAAAVGVQRADYRVGALTLDRDAADAAHRDAEIALAEARALRTRQEQRDRSRLALAALEERAPAVAAQRSTLERALAAEALRAPLEAAHTATVDDERALSRRDTARNAWVLASPESADVDAEGLARLVEELTGRLAVWALAVESEDALALAEAAITRDRDAVARLEESLTTMDAARALVPARLRDLGDELETLGSTEVRLQAAIAALATLDTRREAAREASRLGDALTAAESAYLDASVLLDRDRAEVTALLQRRLAGHAAELAGGLVDDEPCVVCGSLVHPHPAPASEDPVTDDEIQRAEAARDRAASAEKAAADAARTARAAHADAAARAGGESVEALDLAHADATRAAATARDDDARRTTLSLERERLIETDAASALERDALVTELALARDAFVAAEAAAALDRAAVAAARGDFDSVRERIRDAEERRSLATALLDADAAARAARAALERVRSDVEARIAASVFSSSDEATTGLRDAAARAVLDAEIREHDVAIRAERDRLRDLELALAGEPEELVDLAAASVRQTQARERWSAAVDAVAAASQTATRLRDLVQRASDAHAAIDGAAADHAVIVRLADTLAGRAPNTHRMTLESFVLAAELEEIVAAANVRLDDMSAGRYRLLHSDARAVRNAASGLGLEVMDAHTGLPRSPHSLSGGETFLASLALALGLAEVVTSRAGGVRLDTLFVDEGFGALDDDTLELAMRTLDELRKGGRTVGLISHVAAMKEQLPAQLIVEATAHGPSVIRQDAALAV